MRILAGDDLGVARDDNHLVVETEEPRIVFSYCRKGDAISMHFACDRENLRHVKWGINHFCEWAFYAHDWCKMIFGQISLPSVERIVQHCGFEKILEVENGNIYMRLR